MAERTIDKQVVRAGTPVVLGAMILLPIERLVWRADRTSARIWFSMHKEPWALIVQDGDGTRAVDMDAMPLPLEELSRAVPGLNGRLAALAAGRAC